MSGRDDDRWMLFPLYFRERAGTCVVNIALADEARQCGLGVRVLVTIHINSSDNGGAGSREEREALDDATDRVGETLGKLCGGELAGHLREPGYLRQCYYAKGAPSEKAKAAVVRELAGWRTEIEVEADAEWAFFREELLPSDMEWEWASNSDVEASLSKSGDPLTTPREVEHWAYFPDQAAADKYAAWLGSEGFEVRDCKLHERDAEDEREEGESDEPRYVVRFARQDLPSADEITPVTFELRRAAEEHGGDYDGWETAVLKEE